MMYFIPGLGFDCRIFSKLETRGAQVNFLEWIEPLPQEQISEYARRLAGDAFDIPGEKTIVGHSFGGIIALEIAAILPVNQVILISSIKTPVEQSSMFKIIRSIGYYSFFTKRLAVHTFPYWANAHGFRTNEEKELFIDMIGKCTDTYLQWALKALCRWAGARLSCEIIQIHGSMDGVFPIGNLKPPFIKIEGGDHFMVYNRAAAVGNFL